MTYPRNIYNIDLGSIPKNAVIIESTIFEKNNERCNSSFETKIYGNCGHADVLTDQHKHIDPVLRFFSWYTIDDN